MRRVTTFLMILVLLTSATTAAVDSAQEDATPQPEGIPGLSATTLAAGPVFNQPGVILLQLEITLEPGTLVPAHIHPGDLIFSVESGSIVYTTIGGDVDVTWGEAGSESADNVIKVGESATLGAGDYLVEQSTIVHTVENTGDEPAVLILSGLVDPEEPFLQLVDWPATPEA